MGEKEGDLEEEMVVVFDEVIGGGEENILDEGGAEGALDERREEEALDERREEDTLSTNRFDIQDTAIKTDCSRNVFASENVVNLSERVLTGSEIKVLSRGLHFCPTPKQIDKAALIKDLSEFGRRMKCKAYFTRNGDTAQHLQDEITRFKVKSTWTPTLVDPVLDLFLKI